MKMRHGLGAWAREHGRRGVAEIADILHAFGTREEAAQHQSPQPREKESGTFITRLHLLLESNAVKDGAPLAVAGSGEGMTETGSAFRIQPGKSRQDQPAVTLLV